MAAVGDEGFGEVGGCHFYGMVGEEKGVVGGEGDKGGPGAEVLGEEGCVFF